MFLAMFMFTTVSTVDAGNPGKKSRASYAKKNKKAKNKSTCWTDGFKGAHARRK